MEKKQNRYTLCSFKFFKENAVCTYRHEAPESTYYTYDFDSETIKFCISNHLSEHRKRLVIIFSADHSVEHAVKIAYDMYIQRQKDYLEELYGG